MAQPLLWISLAVILIAGGVGLLGSRTPFERTSVEGGTHYGHRGGQRVTITQAEYEQYSRAVLVGRVSGGVLMLGVAGELAAIIWMRLPAYRRWRDKSKPLDDLVQD